jgi:predicted Zn-dependent protease
LTSAVALLGSTDGLLVVIGLLLLVVAAVLEIALPTSLLDRLMYGSAFREVAFERAMVEARRPFVEAAVSREPSLAERARWRPSLTVDPPSIEWTWLADRVAAADEEWAARPAQLPGEPPRWDLANERLLEDWDALRIRRLGPGIQRAKRASRLAWIGGVVGFCLILAGGLGLTNGLWSAPPSGRAAFVPDAPPARSVHLAPLGEVPAATLEALADFYAERYDLRVEVLPATPIPGAARDAARAQLVGEALTDALRTAYPQASDPAQVVIGITSEDVYLRGRPDWAWAFGLRNAGHLAVLSTARMGPERGPFGHQLEAARLRKMVTKYIGILYFGLPESGDPKSVLYGNILGVPDLDAMGDDF